MIGKISISGDIGSYELPDGTIQKGVDLVDVVDQVVALSQGITLIEAEIDTFGGIAKVGFDIYNYLRSLKIPIKTIAVNKCMSIGTVVFFAGDEREARCPLMIHNPWLSNISGDADELLQASEYTRDQEEKLIDFYSKNSKLGKEELAAFMRVETYLTPMQCYTYGFSTVMPGSDVIEINNKYKAVARLNHKQDMSKELLSQFKNLADKVENFISGKTENKIKNLLAKDDSGNELEILNADGSEVTAPAVGNTVMIAGAKASGKYNLPELAVSIDVADGIISAVSPIVDNSKTTDSAILDSLKKENEELKAKLAEKETESVEFAALAKKMEVALGKMTSAPQEFKVNSTFRGPEKTFKETLAEKMKLKK